MRKLLFVNKLCSKQMKSVAKLAKLAVRDKKSVQLRVIVASLLHVLELQ